MHREADYKTIVCEFPAVGCQDRSSFSTDAKRMFDTEGGCDLVVMLFPRLGTGRFVSGQRVMLVSPEYLDGIRRLRRPDLTYL